ncbi:MAG: methylenetetrahydrofolate reductase C-terminal domain-containing protein [Deltaproteobacteria bacterium]|nr:methylenetetrahydrofolate reductase C-terminal domain-containing protein [Deltaproteobacteria bacterium]
MIISEQKPFKEILGYLEDEEKVFIVGCGDCATVCQTGGEEQVKEMKAKLEGVGKIVTGWIVLNPACHILEVKRGFREKKEEVSSANSLLVMACGNGVQAVVEASGKVAHPALNTLFLGSIQRFGQYLERCSLCGECILEKTGGICPLTRCAKGLLNGPCGGAKDGKCEVDPEKDCAWELIFKRLNELGKIERLKEFQPPKAYSRSRRWRVILERKAGVTS